MTTVTSNEVRLSESDTAARAVFTTILSARFAMGNRLIDAMNTARSDSNLLSPELMMECAKNAPMPRRNRDQLGEEYFIKQALAALYPTKVNKFCDGAQPGVDFETYLRRFTVDCDLPISSAVFILALEYIDILMSFNPGLFLHRFNAHRLVLGAFVTALKYHEDRWYFKLSSLTSIGLVTEDQLKEIEREFMDLMSYKCWIKKDTYVCVEREIIREALDLRHMRDEIVTFLHHQYIAGLGQALWDVETNGSRSTSPVRVLAPLTKSDHFNGLLLECEEDVKAANYICLRIQQQEWHKKSKESNQTRIEFFTKAFELRNEQGSSHESVSEVVQANPSVNGWNTDTDNDEWIVSPPSTGVNEAWLRRFRPPSSAECASVTSPSQFKPLASNHTPPVDDDLGGLSFIDDFLASSTPPSGLLEDVTNIQEPAEVVSAVTLEAEIEPIQPNEMQMNDALMVVTQSQEIPVSLVADLPTTVAMNQMHADSTNVTPSKITANESMKREESQTKQETHAGYEPVQAVPQMEMHSPAVSTSVTAQLPHEPGLDVSSFFESLLTSTTPPPEVFGNTTNVMGERFASVSLTAVPEALTEEKLVEDTETSATDVQVPMTELIEAAPELGEDVGMNQMARVSNTRRTFGPKNITSEVVARLLAPSVILGAGRELLVSNAHSPQVVMTAARTVSLVNRRTPFLENPSASLSPPLEESGNAASVTEEGFARTPLTTMSEALGKSELEETNEMSSIEAETFTTEPIEASHELSEGAAMSQMSPKSSAVSARISLGAKNDTSEVVARLLAPSIVLGDGRVLLTPNTHSPQVAMTAVSFASVTNRRKRSRGDYECVSPCELRKMLFVPFEELILLPRDKIQRTEFFALD